MIKSLFEYNHSNFSILFPTKNILNKGDLEASKEDSVYDFILKNNIVPEIVFARTKTTSERIKQETVTTYSLFDKIEGVDLNSSLVCDQIYKEKSSTFNELILVDNLVQYLYDPFPFLYILKKLLLINSNKCIILYDETKKGYNSWTFKEFSNFIRISGFEVEEESEKLHLSVSKSFYSEFLKSIGLNPDAKLLLTCTEHPVLSKKTGGIGSYIQEVEHLLGEKVQILYWGKVKTSARPLSFTNKYFSPNLLKEDTDLIWQSWGKPDSSYQIYHYIRLIKFYNPFISLIEFADYLGLGARTIQAQKAHQLFSDSLKVRVVCHGTEQYIQNCFNKWTALDYNSIAKMLSEKISLTEADEVVFLTRFIKEFYKKYDLVSAKSSTIHRLPLKSKLFENAGTKSPNYKKIEQVVFFGKRNEMKGYNKTLKALILLANLYPQLLPQIKKIVFIGPDFGLFANDFEKVKKIYKNVEEHDFTREQCLEYFDKNSTDSLILVPYIGDNHPVSVLEVIYSHCQLLAFNAGGIPELIPEEFHSNILTLPDPYSLANKIAENVKLPVESRVNLLTNLVRVCKNDQEKINKSFVQETLKVEDIPTKPTPKISPISIVIPYYNTDLNYVTNLFDSIRNQTKEPDEVIVVNDSSKDESFKSLKALISDYSDLKIKLVSHEVNKGLAATRNTGVKSASHDLVICVDSDDILLPIYASHCTTYMVTNPEIAVACPILVGFKDGDNWEKGSFEQLGSYLALDPGKVAGSIYNYFGHSNLIIRKSAVIETGGWGEEDKSMWEDWAFYLKLSSLGYKIGFIPTPGVLYRVRENSMLRTYKEFPAENRLARSLTGFSGFDASLFINLVNNFKSTIKTSKSDSPDFDNNPYPWAFSGKGEATVLKLSYHVYHFCKKNIYRFFKKNK